MIKNLTVFVDCCTLVITEGHQIIYYFSCVKRLVPCRFIIPIISEEPAGNKIRQKIDIIPEVKIISGKANATSINEAWGFF